MRIALIAHDRKKDELVAFARRWRHVFARHQLVATGTTGRLVAEATGLPVHCFLPGPLGGDQQIGSEIAAGRVDAVFFLRDPLTAHPHEPDITALLRLCDVRGIPIATNLAGAHALVRQLAGEDAVLHDITRLLSPDLEPWPGDSPFSLEWTWLMGPGSPVNVSKISLSPHVGTHADAPLHYEAGGQGIDGVPVDVYVGQALVLDVEALLDRGVPRPPITPKILETALRQAQAPGRPAPGAPGGEDSPPAAFPMPQRVLVRTGYRPQRPFNRDFAHFVPGAVDWLAARGVRLLGTDAPSVDDFDSKTLPAHAACSRHGILIIENLDLAAVAPGTYRLVALPLRIAGADASPVRAVLIQDG
ncbi:MAG: methylglyoxal synthase [Bacillota bacterium]|nr:MAG: methylglyoxal synthase [Bacillota bacterium]